MRRAKAQDRPTVDCTRSASRSVCAFARNWIRLCLSVSESHPFRLARRWDTAATAQTIVLTDTPRAQLQRGSIHQRKIMQVGNENSGKIPQKENGRDTSIKTVKKTSESSKVWISKVCFHLDPALPTSKRSALFACLFSLFVILPAFRHFPILLCFSTCSK